MALIGRAEHTLSRNKLGDYFTNSILSFYWKPKHKLNSQNFLNYMEKLDENTIKDIEKDVATKLVELGYKPSKLIFDTTNFYTQYYPSFLLNSPDFRQLCSQITPQSKHWSPNQYLSPFEPHLPAERLPDPYSELVEAEPIPVDPSGSSPNLREEPISQHYPDVFEQHRNEEEVVPDDRAFSAGLDPNYVPHPI